MFVDPVLPAELVEAAARFDIGIHPIPPRTVQTEYCLPNKFFEFIHNDQDQVSDPQQRGRNAKFMRDMTRHLRGRDIATNQPVDGPK